MATAAAAPRMARATARRHERTFLVLSVSGLPGHRSRMRRLCDGWRNPGLGLTARDPVTIRPPTLFPRPRLVDARAASARSQVKDFFEMSRRCDLTGKAAQTGHKVSHSNRKTKRRFLPNLCNVTMMSDALGRSVRLRISANALKTVDRRGGLDAFLMKARDQELAPRALDLKRQIAKKRAVA